VSGMSTSDINYTQVFNCTEYPQTYQVPSSGVYFIEAYGAQGGGRQSSRYTDAGIGGKGGYAAGKVNLEKGTILYVYVGCVGSSSGMGVVKGGYNGGGYACAATGDSEPGNGGGGASDVRLIGGSWDNSNGLLSRFIVAGGGGGGGEDSGDTGGYGGGISGGQGFSAGSGGEFGKGAHTNREGGGGGGGWIGGNAHGGSQTIPTSCSTSWADGGCGGSGYVYTNTSEVYNGYLVPTKYQMFDAVLTPNVNEGHGSVKITLKSIIIINEKCKCTHYNRASLIASFNLISLTGILILK
jgi:hypothetical protein